MFDKIYNFFITIITYILNLFGINSLEGLQNGGEKVEPNKVELTKVELNEKKE